VNSDGSYGYAADGAAARALGKGVKAQETFTYTVRDAFGKTATAQLVIEVTGRNDGPAAKALSRTLSEDGTSSTFAPDFEDADAGDTHSISVDSTGTIGKVTLNSDGTFSYDPNGKFESLRAGQTATDTFTYTVTDSDGAASTRSVTVTIEGKNDGPAAKDLAGTASEGSSGIGFTPDFTDVDAGDTHTITFDTAGTVGKVVLNNGAFTYSPDGKFEGLRAGQTATDTFTYTVTDAAGGASTKTVTVTVTGENDGPVAKALAGTASESGGAINFAPDFTDADLGDTHTISINSTGTVGKVILNTDGTFSYDANGKFETLKLGQTATDTFTYTVKDAAGALSTQTVKVTIIGENDRPTLQADIAGVVKNGSISMTAAKGVLSNDSDIEGDALSVSAVNGSAAAVGKALLGTYGTLTLKADGSYTYVTKTMPGSLPSRMASQDTFTYTVSDGKGGSTTETLTITLFEKGTTYLRGTDAGDTQKGGTSSTVLDGGNGNDTLLGGNGADTIIGGSGNDFLTGGKGSDVFVFASGFGHDVITDFQVGLDRLQFSKSVFSDYASMVANAQMSGSDVILTAPDGSTLTLKIASFASLQPGDFLFI
jgi:VCBS repeat-containing protein